MKVSVNNEMPEIQNHEVPILNLADQLTDMTPSKTALENQPPRRQDFKPGWFFRFLPANCQMELDPSRNLDFPGPGFGQACPQWTEICVPSVLVGTCTDQAPDVIRDQKRTIIHMAGEEVFLEPKPQRPYYRLVAGRIILNHENVLWNQGFATDLERMLAALDLLHQSYDMFQSAMKLFRETRSAWRIKRRTFEFSVLAEMWKIQSPALPPDFSQATLEMAQRYVVDQNERDKRNEIDPWNVGIPLHEIEGKPVIRFAQYDANCTKEYVEGEIKKFEEAILDLGNAIEKAQAIEAELAQGAKT